MAVDEKSENVNERPELRGRLLMGRMWDADRETFAHVLFVFADETGPAHGTIRGGPVLFGTFTARWEDETLLLKWTCAHREGVTEGQSVATVDQLAGGRLLVKSPAADTLPDVPAILEEPMADTHG